MMLRPKTMLNKSGYIDKEAIEQLVLWMNEVCGENSYSVHNEYFIAHKDGRVFAFYNNTVFPEIERIEKLTKSKLMGDLKIAAPPLSL